MPERGRRRRPVLRDELVNLSHGAGGKATRDLVEVLFLEELRNEALAPLGDSAVLAPADGRLALTTDGYVAELDGGLTLAALAERLGRPLATVAPLTRGDTPEGPPPALVAEVFAAEPGAAVVLADGATVILAQIGAVEPFDPAAADSVPVVEAIEQQFDDQAADDVLTSFVAAIRDGAGVSVNQALVESTLARFP